MKNKAIRILLVSVCAWGWLLCCGQQFEVKNFTCEPADLSTVTSPRSDRNGKPCALVKVQVPMPGVAFEGNVVGKTDFKTGEYWVYLSGGSKYLMVKHASCSPTRISFAGHGITVSPKKTYVLTLAPPKSVMADVTFRFAVGTVQDDTLKARMERNISALLTEIDRAGRSDTELDLSGISMEPIAKERLDDFWDYTAHMVCDKNTNISKCLIDLQGYQVRNIPVTMKPVDSSYDGALNRNLSISLNKQGVISGVRPTLESIEDVSEILKSPGGMADTQQRREILKWIEDFRCYYHERNLTAIKQIYSDNLLIIRDSAATGHINKADNVANPDQKVNYTQESNDKYISNLSEIFKKNSPINVDVDQISVVMHWSDPNIYGVTLHQKLQTSSYSDGKWLFFLWDFNDPQKPQIQVCAMQSDKVDRNEVFTLDDFFIP